MSPIELTVRDDGIATILINRPERRNAIDLEMHAVLGRTWSELETDDRVRAVIITGAGDAFSAGGDKSGFATFADKDVREQSSAEARHLFFRMLHFPRPVIAAVRGPAVGLGCTIALLSDVVVAGQSAFFADPHLSAGLVPGDGGAALWGPAVGHAKAKYFLYTGERISAGEAEQIGLIACAVPDAEVSSRAESLARQLGAIEPGTFEATKRLVNVTIARDAVPIMDFGLVAEERSMLTLKTGGSA